MQVIAYAIQAPGLPFPAFVMSFVINGVGMAVQVMRNFDALPATPLTFYIRMLKPMATSRVSKTEQKRKWDYCMRRMVGDTETRSFQHHRSWNSLGAGAFLSPLVATQFAQLPHWSFHYLTSLGIAVSNTLLLWVVFRLKTQDGAYLLMNELKERHHSKPRPYECFSECLEEIGQDAVEKGTSEHSAFRQILSIKAVHLLAFFILVYVGVEVTMGGVSRLLVRHRSTLTENSGWIVTYIIRVRGGGPSAGYISSGFFGGQFCSFTVVGNWVLIPNPQVLWLDALRYYGSIKRCVVSCQG